MKKRRYSFKVRYQVYVEDEIEVAAETEEEAEDAVYDRLDYLTSMDIDAVEGSGEIMDCSEEDMAYDVV